VVRTKQAAGLAQPAAFEKAKFRPNQARTSRASAEVEMFPDFPPESLPDDRNTIQGKIIRDGISPAITRLESDQVGVSIVRVIVVSES